MLGIEDYGSGSDNDNDEPPPTAISTAQQKLKRPPKKIAIRLPNIKDDEDDDLKDERPVAKKPRLQSGAGSSSLLSILPQPKQKNPLPPSSERVRVLGGGRGPGLVFNTVPQGATGSLDTYDDDRTLDQSTNGGAASDSQHSTLPHLFLPPSLAKGKPSISVEADAATSRPISQPRNTAPAIDFFSLENTTKPIVATTSSSTPSLSSVSSAPSIPTFEPPEPSQNDPYPGYYQLPSGAWAAHDPEVFAKFVKKWQSDYNAHVRALEKGAVKGFEGLDTAAVEEVNAMKEMERAKIELQDREEKKAVTRGADGGPIAPKMTITASKMSGIARSRHQLSTLLKEAYENREALEERIAQGRRNRKEAGNKYGF